VKSKIFSDNYFASPGLVSSSSPALTSNRDAPLGDEIIVGIVFGLHQWGVGISETSKSGLR
jgi:hypothetical protein